MLDITEIHLYLNKDEINIVLDENLKPLFKFLLHLRLAFRFVLVHTIVLSITTLINLNQFEDTRLNNSSGHNCSPLPSNSEGDVTTCLQV